MSTTADEEAALSAMFGGAGSDAMDTTTDGATANNANGENAVKPEDASDAKGENEQQEEEDEEDDDELEIVLNTDAIGKVEAPTGPIKLTPGMPAPSSATNAAGFQQKQNYFRQPMVIQQGNKYSKTPVPGAKPQQQQPTLQIQTFISSGGSGNQSLVPILGHSGVKKMQLELDIDSIEDKGWRKPGAENSDYFNYGFTEDSWRLYCQKQVAMRQESSQLQQQVNARPVAPPVAAAVPVQPGTAPLQITTRPPQGPPPSAGPVPLQPGMPPMPMMPPHVPMIPGPGGMPMPVPGMGAPIPPQRPLQFQPAPAGGVKPPARLRARDQDDSVVQVIAGGDDADTFAVTPTPAAPAAPSVSAAPSAAAASSSSSSSSSSSKPPSSSQHDDRRGSSSRDEDRRGSSSRDDDRHRSSSRDDDRHGSSRERSSSSRRSRSRSRSRDRDSRRSSDRSRKRSRSRSRSPHHDSKRRRRD